MPRFLIERNFAEELEVTKDDVDRVQRINDEVGVKWLFSFLSADKKKTYCLYEAPSADAIRQAAKRANIPADVIIEISRESEPNDVCLTGLGVASLTSLRFVSVRVWKVDLATLAFRLSVGGHDAQRSNYCSL